MKDTWKQEPRKVFCWLKGAFSGEGAVNLHWQTREPPTEVGARVMRAEKEWGSLWKHEQPYLTNVNRDMPLTDITVDDLNEVLRKIPKNKAGGADHWKPQELLVLPRVFLQKRS